MPEPTNEVLTPGSIPDVPDVFAAIAAYTHAEYREQWYARFGEAETAHIDVAGTDKTVHMTLWPLSPAQFDHLRSDLNKLHDAYQAAKDDTDRAAAAKSMLFYEAQLLL